MIIEYANNVDDFVALSVDHLSTKPAKRAVRSAGIWVGACLALGFVIAVGWKRGPFMIALGPALGIASFFLYRPLARRHALSATRKLYSNAAMSKGVVGWHRLSLEADGLHEQSEAGGMTTRYDVISGISESATHVFVYITAAGAHVIPRNAVTVGDLASFMTALAARMDANIPR
jgi:hypothetical protein